MRTSNKSNTFSRVFRGGALLNGLAVAVALSSYAYGGLFSRYLAEDYCQSVRLRESGNLITAIVKGYNSWLNSYSILFFVQTVDWAGTWGIRLMSTATILLLMGSMVWLVSEAGKSAQIRYGATVNFWIGGSIIYLSLYQAPNLYQILYWRSSLIPYTLPLAFFAGTAAFILWYTRQPYQKSLAIGAGAASAGLVFFASGLGETVSALQIGLLFIAVLMTRMTLAYHQRKDVNNLLVISLAVAVISLSIIAASPGTATRLNNIMTRSPLYNPIDLSVQTITFTAQFLWDTFKALPLPKLISLLIPLGIHYFYVSNDDRNGSQASLARIRFMMVMIPVLMFIAIGFSFAPSTFVRTFPATRVRFAAHFVLTLSLALEGGLLGMLAARLRIPVAAEVKNGILLVLLGLLFLYPIQVSKKVVASSIEYRNFAAAWDARDEYIRQSVSDGAKDLVVVQIDSMGGVGEYKGNERHWINRCAADYYGLNTLRAP